MYMQSLIPGVAGCASYHIKHKHNCPAAGTISVNGGLRPPEEDFLRVFENRVVLPKLAKYFTQAPKGSDSRAAARQG